MKGYPNIVRILMIFLLLWFAVPVTVYAQDAPEGENEFYYLPETNNNASALQALSGNGQQGENEAESNASPVSRYVLNDEEEPVVLPDNFKHRVEFLKSQRESYSLQDHENAIRLYMEGDGNTVQASQQGGKGNIMDLGVDGDSNEGNYLQQGNRNYIFDRIEGNEIYREIEQYGDGHGIYNEGMQTIPMIIEQRGPGMKIKIE